MNNNSSVFEQTALVITRTSGSVKLALQGNGGCSECNNSLCMISESRARWVEVTNKDNAFNIGDTVIVRINRSSGYAGVIWLYVLPFVLMMLMLIGTLSVGMTEVIAGLSTIFVLAPYFLVLFLFRSKFASRCKIEVIRK